MTYLIQHSSGYYMAMPVYESRIRGREGTHFTCDWYSDQDRRSNCKIDGVPVNPIIYRLAMQGRLPKKQRRKV